MLQNEAKYIKSFKLLIIFEDHRQAGIIPSRLELNIKQLSKPLKVSHVQNIKQKEIEPHHTRSGHGFIFSNTKKQTRNGDKSNNSDKILKLRGNPKERRRMRKELLCRHDVSNYDDQSIEYLIENLIELEKNLIAE